MARSVTKKQVLKDIEEWRKSGGDDAWHVANYFAEVILAWATTAPEKVTLRQTVTTR